MIRLGTRSSPLALAQAHTLAAMLQADGHKVEIIEFTTEGDRNRAARDKSKWVGELERALLSYEVDAAVHSAKDVPTHVTEGTAIHAVAGRQDPRDVLIGASKLDDLPEGAVIGTSSLRRGSQLLASRRDFRILPVRGNIDTRLGKLETGEYDAIVLAAAGLLRLDRRPINSVALDGVPFVPAAGQGMLAVQVRSDDNRMGAAATLLSDRYSTLALAAERTLAGALGADCNSSVGAHCKLQGTGDDIELYLFGYVGMPDGSGWVVDQQLGSDPVELGMRVAQRLLRAGADELIHAARGEEVAGEIAAPTAALRPSADVALPTGITLPDAEGQAAIDAHSALPQLPPVPITQGIPEDVDSAEEEPVTPTQPPAPQIAEQAGHEVPHLAHSVVAPPLPELSAEDTELLRAEIEAEALAEIAEEQAVTIDASSAPEAGKAPESPEELEAAKAPESPEAPEEDAADEDEVTVVIDFPVSVQSAPEAAQPVEDSTSAKDTSEPEESTPETVSDAVELSESAAADEPAIAEDLPAPVEVEAESAETQVLKSEEPAERVPEPPAPPTDIAPAKPVGDWASLSNPAAAEVSQEQADEETDSTENVEPEASAEDSKEGSEPEVDPVEVAESEDEPKLSGRQSRRKARALRKKAARKLPQAPPVPPPAAFASPEKADSESPAIGKPDAAATDSEPSETAISAAPPAPPKSSSKATESEAPPEPPVVVEAEPVSLAEPQDGPTLEEIVLDDDSASVVPASANKTATSKADDEAAEDEPAGEDEAWITELANELAGTVKQSNLQGSEDDLKAAASKSDDADPDLSELENFEFKTPPSDWKL